MHLLKRLAVEFPQLTLEPPLFHRWTIGLRFELGVEGPTWPDYFSKLHHRAKTIYEAAFSAQDVCYLASVDYRSKGAGRISRKPRGFFDRARRHTPPLFDSARQQNRGIGRPSGRQRFQVDVETTSTITWAQISSRRIDYEWILRTIAREDFPVGAGFPGETYFVNLSRNLIFHMYDDRGLDIVATRPAALQPIFDAHRPWLLSYNLERMEAMFLDAATV